MWSLCAFTSPVTSENNMTPRDHQSAAWLYGPPPKTSGAAQTKPGQKDQHEKIKNCSTKSLKQ